MTRSEARSEDDWSRSTQNLASALRVPNPNAALVVEAPPGGAGGPARVQFGDIIAGLNGAAVTGANELRQRFASIGPGRDVELEVWRIGAGDGFLPALRRLAADGNAAAMYRLGRLYATASGVERDEVEAVRWYQKGADGGDQNAITALAVAKLEGRGTARDDPEGVRLLRRAADEGNTEAVYRYAVAMVEGKIVGKDTAEALRQLNKCAEAGFTPAMLELAQLYNTGEGVPLDAAKTAAWYRQAADLGNPIGMVNLGFMYHQGKGLERNDITAVAWYRKAASEGNSLGVHNLAAMLDKGQGVARKDPDQAADLVLHALELRNEFTLRQMTNNSRAWSAEFRRALQKKLQQAGFFTGKIDGELRSTTVEALKAYINRKR